MPGKSYIVRFSDRSIFQFLQGKFRGLGQQFVYSLLLMYYAYQRGDTPGWAKNIIIGTIGYVLTPIDSVPDVTPFIGYTDDLGILSFGLVTIACYINDGVRQKAKDKMATWFKSLEADVLQRVDERL